MIYFHHLHDDDGKLYVYSIVRMEKANFINSNVYFLDNSIIILDE